MKKAIVLASVLIACCGIGTVGRAQSTTAPVGASAQPAGDATQTSSLPVFDGSKALGVPAARGVAVAQTPPPSSGKGNVLGLGQNVGRSKKPSVAAGGVWKWTTYNRSLQPMENVLTLSVDKKGRVIGTLVDRTGQHQIENAALGTDTVTFDVKYHTRGVGDLPHNFTVNLDPDNPGVSVDRPDLTPFGKANGGKHHSEHPAKHDTSG